MKILLVQAFGSGAPPLGLCLLSAELKQGGYKDISLVDITRGDMKKSITSYYRSEDYFKEKLKEKPDVVMFTASVATFKEAHEAAKIARKYTKCIVFGGPHATIFQHSVLKLVPEIDIIVYGEADLIICDLMKKLESNEELAKLPNVVYRKEGRIIKNLLGSTVTTLDELPFPDRTILDTSSYPGFLTLLTSRGCPYSCNFCSRPVTGKFFRGRSAKNIVDEIETLLIKYVDFAKKTNNHFPIIDENFGVDKSRVYAFCDELIKRNIKIKFSLPNGLHVASADVEMFKKMKEAGCEVIYFGAESGSDKVLKIMKKSSTRAMIQHAVNCCHKAGLRAGAHFAIGWQGETKETAQETLNLIKEGRFDHVNLNQVVPEPGTPLWEYVAKEGKMLFAYRDIVDYSNFYMDNIQPQFETPEFTKDDRVKVYEEGLQIIDNLFRKKVLSVKNMIQFVRKTKNPKDYIWATRRLYALLTKRDLRRIYQPKPSVIDDHNGEKATISSY